MKLINYLLNKMDLMDFGNAYNVVNKILAFGSNNIFQIIFYLNLNFNFFTKKK